jgi:arylsulfatase A
VEKLGTHQPAGPFSGGKYSVLEGGTRIPFITRWKGRIQPGVSEQIVCTIDLPASLAALTGAALPADACRDSFNVLPALLGESGAKGRDHLLQQDNGSGNFGLRAGDWKLVRRKVNAKSEATVSRKNHKASAGLHALYFLPDDPGEETDLSAKHPEKAKELIAKLDALVAAAGSR